MDVTSSTIASFVSEYIHTANMRFKGALASSGVTLIHLTYLLNVVSFFGKIKMRIFVFVYSFQLVHMKYVCM